MTQVSKIFAGVLSAIVLLGSAQLAQAEDTKGTVRAVSAEKNDIVLKGIVNDSTYFLKKGIVIVLDGRKTTNVADLKEGDRAKITYDKQGDQNIATAVRVWRNASETTGTLKFVIADKNELVLKGTLKDTTYFMDQNPTIYINSKVSHFSDLREGDTVTLTYITKGDHNMVAEVIAVRN